MASNEPLYPVRRWAVLIGVNLYNDENGQRANMLKGAVNDVTHMKAYLERNSIHELNIFVFTATVPFDQTSNKPREHPARWPTYDNVTTSIWDIINDSNPGDQVLIYYSGHGTRKLDDSGARQSLALVLYHDQRPFTRYLYGEELARCMRKLVNQGLVVTLVLDCCFSGSVRRNPQELESVRTIAYNPLVEGAFPNNALREYVTQEPDAEGWIVDPKGYTVLAACGPNEKAHEVRIRGSQDAVGSSEVVYKGALSCFLQQALDTLEHSSVVISHQSLYERIKVEFQASCSSQNPMRYGSSSSTLFGTILESSGPLLPSLYRQDDCLFLTEGTLHGVSIGDTYATFPFGTLESDRTSQQVRVIGVEGTTSKVEVVQGPQVKTLLSPGTGWGARLLDSASQRKVLVQITPGAYFRLGEAALFQEKMFLRLCTTENKVSGSDFTLILNDQDDYVILDHLTSSLEGLLPLPAGRPNAALDIMRTLQHLATYEYFRKMGTGFEFIGFDQSYSLEAFVDSPPPNSAEDFVEECLVEDQSCWNLDVQNHTNDPLFLAIFDFTSSWAISYALDLDQSGYRRVEANSTEHIRLRMGVPQSMRDQGKYSCKDVLKVFLTDKPTTFPSLVLKALYADHRRRAGESELERAKMVSDLMQRLTTTTRREGNSTSTSARWITRNYTIRTITRSA